MSTTRFEVQQLRMQNAVCILMSIAIYVGVLFTVAILPSLLIQYLYAGQQLFEQPPILNYIPLVGFVVATAYFLYMLVAVAIREIRARKLVKLAMSEGECCGSCEGCMTHSEDLDVTDEELAELESIVEKAMSKKPAKTAKKTGKRVSKK